jgi:WD40 repeat protein
MTPRNFSMLALGMVLALCGHAAAQDYAKFRVLDAKVIEDMSTSAGQRAALLSPDGSRVLHLNGREFCLLAPSQIGPWAEIACAESTPENRPGEAADMLWSPASDRLLMPTYTDGLLHLKDTDIRLFDPATFTVRNLTDDGFDGSFLMGKRPANLDVLAHWIDSDTIAFVRFAIPEGGYTKGASTSLMTIDVDGGDPRPVLEIASRGGMPVWAIAVSADGKQIAYSVADKQNADKAGIYLLNPGEATPKRVAAMSDVGKPPTGLAFSADGKFLLLLGPNPDGVDAHVIDLAGGGIVPVDPAQKIAGVAWSPSGSALAYITYDRTRADMPGGLFLADAPGKPARLLIGGAFFPTVCCGQQPFTWASNDTMILAQLGDKLGTVLFVRLGQ